MPSFNISPTFTGPVSFGAVLKNASNPGGILVSALFTSSFSDVNGNSFAGIAISSDTSVSATDGNWQYSLDGTTWVDINKPPSNKVPLIDQALLLSSSTYLRFVPALNFGGTPGSLTVFAVDNSSSTTFSTAINQRYFDTTGDDHRAIDANQSRVSASGVLLTATINNAPTVSEALVSNVLEGATAYNLNLLLHASDVDAGDTLTVGSVTYSINGTPTGSGGTDLPSGLTRVGALFTVDPTDVAFNHLAAGEHTTILASYIISDGHGGSVAQTETITINGTNDLPTVSAAESSTASEGDSPYSLNMLLHASDPDTSDMLTVGSVTYTVDGTPTGNGGDDFPVGVTRTGGILTVDPTNPAFNHLAIGESAIIIASYTITDGHGGSVHQSATVTINGTNDAPTVSGAGSSSASLGSAAYNLNLFLLASDPEGDPLTVSNVTYTVDGTPTGNGGNDLPSGVTLTGSTLRVDPDNAAYDYVVDGGHVTIVASYTISDGHGGSALQTETVTLNRTMDFPLISQPESSTVSEGDISTDLNLLLHSSDPDDDDLTVENVIFTVDGVVTGHGGSDLPSGVTLTGSTLALDPTHAAFDYLAVGECTTILLNYSVIDHAGGSVAQTETITINGTNDPPTVLNAESSTASEGDSPYSLNMLLHATDPDTSDMLTVGSVTYTVGGTPTGNGGDDLPVGVTLTGGTLTVDPTNPAFNHLAVGESAIIIASYTIADGHGGSVHQSATVMINGTNDAPSVSGAGSSSVSLGSAAYNQNLLLLASDPEGDPLTIINVTYTVDGIPTGNGGSDLPSGVTLTGSTLSINPDNAAYDYVLDGGHVTIVASYTIVDGHGGSVLQTETVRLNRATDFPLISQQESSTVSEGDIPTDLNLLLHASDPDDDDLSVESVIYTVDSVATGNGGSDLPFGVTRSGSLLRIYPSSVAFNHLAVGEYSTILASYSVADNAGGSVAQTETITINGTNDLPTVSAAESSTASEGEASYNLNLLLHATDPDTSDTLTVGSVTYTVDGTPTGNGGDDLPQGVIRRGSTLTVDPNDPAFNHLAVGENITILVSFTIADSHGGSVHQSATVTINGTNDAPMVSGAKSSSVSLGSAAYNQNLLLLASDPEGDPLTVSNVTYTVDGTPTGDVGHDLPSGITLTGSTLRVDPNNAAYDYVLDGGHVTIVASYTISDGHGGSVLQTETVTLNRTTDFPLISQQESSTVSEGDIPTDLNLLLHSSDPDDDDLTVENVIYTVDGVATGNGGSNRPSGVMLTGSTLTLDPTHAIFDYLAVGEHITILVDYSVIDHAGGSVAQTETITINGTNDAPTVLNAESSTVSEGEASYNMNLLLHASDPDTSDTLTVGSVTYTVDGTPTGNGGDDLPQGVIRRGSTLTVDPHDPAFNHLAVGESAIIIASYTIADGNGGSVDQTATVTINGSSETNEADVTPPTVIAFSPENGATGVAINNNIVLTFSEAVLRGTGTIAIHSGSSEGAVMESYDAATSTNLTLSGTTLTINPTNSLVHGTHYSITFANGSINDYAGNQFGGTTSYDFTTGADPFAAIHGDDDETTELILGGVGALGFLAWLVF